MRTPAAILLAFSIVVGSGPCVAQSALDLPLERLEQPIALAYNELERRNFSTHLEVTAFKGDNTFSSHEWRSEGTISSRAMGDDLEVSLKVILDNDMVSQPVCIMHRTGEIIDCTAGGGLDTLGFFIFINKDTNLGIRLNGQASPGLVWYEIYSAECWGNQV
jgi:hypothetical protein